MAALAAGDLDTARDQARRTVRMLAEYVRDGYRVVCLDPTSVVALRIDYPSLLTDADAKAVAANCTDVMSLLWQWHQSGDLKTDFRDQDLTIAHHVPCHMKAIQASDVTIRLLQLIPGLTIMPIDKGCSGMMGPWGLLKVNRALSQAVGAGMIDALRDRSIQYGSSECGSCRVQMQDANGRRAVHPIQYVAMAYGLLPEIGRRLMAPLKDRVSR
jgi:Fe-S oxidoreductase